MLTIDKVKFRNFMSYGGAWSEVDLSNVQLTVVSATNGSGKCLDKRTNIKVRAQDERCARLLSDFMKKRIKTANG